MHPMLIEEVIENCRKRMKEGDCPSTTSFSNEQLEDAVLGLAHERDTLLSKVFELKNQT